METGNHYHFTQKIQKIALLISLIAMGSFSDFLGEMVFLSRYVLKKQTGGQYSISKTIPIFHPHYHTHSGNTSRPVNLAVVRWLVSYEDDNDNGNEIED